MSEMVQNALIAMLTAFIVSIISLLASRRMTIAQADATTSGEWKGLYEEMKKRVDRLETKFAALEIRYDCAQDALSTAWQGHQENLKQIYQADETPRFKPSSAEFFLPPKE